MSQKREELETKLMAKSKEAIQKLLDNQKPKEDLTLSDLEISVGQFGDDLLQAVMQEMVSDASETERQGLECPTCQKAMRYKGRKSKRMVTLRGDIEIERDYYYCETCRRGLFPPR